MAAAKRKAKGRAHRDPQRGVRSARAHANPAGFKSRAGSDARPAADSAAELSPLACALTPQGWKLLESLPAFTPAEGTTISAGLRKRGVPAQLVNAVMLQRQLRYEAQAKLGDFAADLVYTRAGLEQATRLVVAALHAQRFVQAGITHVADLGCGLGIDSYALAGLGVRVTAVDIDPERVAAARVNLRFFPEAKTLLADACKLDFAELGIGATDGIFADPARRRGGRRLLNPEEWSPPLSTILRWQERVPALGCKVAPGIAHELIPDGWQAQWTSVDGDLVEAALWAPPLCREGAVARVAHVIRQGQHYEVAATKSDPQPGPLLDYLFEPDAAIIRAGAIGTIAAQYQAHTLHPQIAYLTAAAPLPAWAGASFQVLQVVPARANAIAGALAELGAGAQTPLEILKRGVQLEPAQLRRKIQANKTLRRVRSDAAGEAHSGGFSVILTRAEDAHIAIIARRV